MKRPLELRAVVTEALCPPNSKDLCALLLCGGLIGWHVNAEI